MKIKMYSRCVVTICIMLLANFSPINAQQTPDKVVKDFGEALSSWCNTNEIIYREKIDELCSGSKKCRVEDKIHADYQKQHGLTNYETFVLDSYMNMFQSLMSKSVNYQMSNVKVVGSDEMPDGTLTFITADIKVSGALSHTVTDLFLVRNNKITGIYSYSSKLGFLHLNGSLINTLKTGRYIWTNGFQNGYATVTNEAYNVGLIDIKGNVIIPTMWRAISFLGGDFARVDNFRDNSNNNKKSVTYDLRKNGKRTPLYRVQDFNVEHRKFTPTFSEDYAVVYNEENKCGYLHKNDSTYTVRYIYDGALPFNDGYAFVKCAGAGMIIDKLYNPILQGTKVYAISDGLYGGLARVKDRKTQKYGFINKKGELVIPCLYDIAYRFSEGICVVGLIRDKIEYTYGCINTKGDIIIPIRYDDFPRAGWPYFENGYIAAKKDGHGTLLGVDGKPLSGFSWEYDDVSRIYEGFVRFEKDGKFGFLNAKGDIVIPAIYDFADIFVDGIACVSVDDKYGKYKYGGINTDGILVIPCIYDNIFSFENGIALVKKDGQVGLIDKYGNSIFMPQYSGGVRGVTFSASEEPVKVDAEAEGFGRCSVSGCHCKEFEGRGQTCKNCGHAYSKHY